MLQVQLFAPVAKYVSSMTKSIFRGYLERFCHTGRIMLLPAFKRPPFGIEKNLSLFLESADQREFLNRLDANPDRFLFCSARKALLLWPFCSAGLCPKTAWSRERPFSHSRGFLPPTSQTADPERMPGCSQISSELALLLLRPIMPAKKKQREE